MGFYTKKLQAGQRGSRVGCYRTKLHVGRNRMRFNMKKLQVVQRRNRVGCYRRKLQVLAGRNRV